MRKYERRGAGMAIKAPPGSFVSVSKARSMSGTLCTGACIVCTPSDDPTSSIVRTREYDSELRGSNRREARLVVGAHSFRS
jgi:hypothetical protein